VVFVSAENAGVLSITRGAAGTTAEAHAAGTPVTRPAQTRIAGFPEMVGVNESVFNTSEFAWVVDSENETVVEVADSAGAGIVVGVHILIGGEMMLVGAVSAPNVTVTRGQLGTTAANHSVAAPVLVVTTTTLSNGADLMLSTTSVTLSSVANPVIAAGSFLRIEAEVVMVTNVAATTVTVTRAAGGSVAAAHSDGSTVTLDVMTTLVAGLNTSDASVSLISGGASAVGVSISGQFVSVGAETMRVLDVTGDVLTVARAAAGSAAAAHGGGARVTLVAGASLTANASASDGALFLTGVGNAGIVNASFVQIGGETLQVVSVSDGSISVLRAQAGSAASSHLIAASVVLVRSSTFTVAYEATADVAELKVLSASAALIETGSVLKVGGEFVVVTGVPDDSRLLVQRAAFNTTALSHASSTSVSKDDSRLEVQRAAFNTTALSHASSTSVSKVLPPNVPLVLDITLRNPEIAQPATSPTVTVTGTWGIVAPLDPDTSSFLYSRVCGAPGPVAPFSPDSPCETTLAVSTVETVLTRPTLRTRLLTAVMITDTFVVVASADDAGLVLGDFFQVDAEVFRVDEITMADPEGHKIAVTRAMQDTSAAAHAARSAAHTTEIRLLDATGAGIGPGSLVLIGSEMLLVLTEVGEFLTVRRAQRGTTAATHTTGVVVATWKAVLTLTDAAAAGLAEVIEILAVNGNALSIIRARLSTTFAPHSAGSSIRVLAPGFTPGDSSPLLVYDPGFSVLEIGQNVPFFAAYPGTPNVLT
ncbi:hypothetical protein T484DRAFT_1800976, partial [Baffinella frigidus]